ncbi:hypothetical protein C7974DRAFT_396213 [Boeremia exigua]|uniref:uncharacterized protein n=1 Tax=Boeremia exigua TaxID=749465 RepID=UPI001E8D0D23|nr:uncharacterized protein C7974DRAFT_396213 [Boeremia exigua]KAH6625518.1 hypothetical protein C7974DRAFT_396213 [Boeremia exigua]
MLADLQQRFVVNASSGCLELSEGVSKYSLSRTHFDMNKFGKTSEEDFETVCEVIREMTQINQHHGCSVSNQKSPGAQYMPGVSGPSEGLESSVRSLQALGLGLTTNACTPVPQKPKGKKKKSSASRVANEWSPAEDVELVRIVQAMESPDWKRAARHFTRRSSFACQKRYEKVTSLRLP